MDNEQEYGEAWEKELMKCDKKTLISLYKKQILYSNRIKEQSTNPSSESGKLRNGLEKIEQFSDSGDYAYAIVKMKAIATEALSTTQEPEKGLSESTALDENWMKELMGQPKKDIAEYYRRQILYSKKLSEQIKKMTKVSGDGGQTQPQTDDPVQEFDEVENPQEVIFDKCLNILKDLVLLKELKDRDGKTEYYLLNQPYIWDRAKEFLKKHQK